MAGAALVLLTVETSAPPAVLLKGSPSLAVTVLHDGEVTVQEQPLETVEGLRPGDSLQLRISGSARPWVLLQGWQEEGWVTYFAGPPPADRWLPVGVEITDSGETRLRFISCTTPQTVTNGHLPADCVAKVYNL